MGSSPTLAPKALQLSRPKCSKTTSINAILTIQSTSPHIHRPSNQSMLIVTRSSPSFVLETVSFFDPAEYKAWIEPV